MKSTAFFNMELRTDLADGGSRTRGEADFLRAFRRFENGSRLC